MKFEYINLDQSIKFGHQGVARKSS
jgi:hypothetical protein